MAQPWNDRQKESIKIWFGEKYLDKEARLHSYGLLESIVTATPIGVSADTAVGLKLLTAALEALSDQELAFLITHSGFIPDHYGDDSSQETLYSKLMEALVFAWGNRLGFKMVLPTAKSSTEDVTFVYEPEQLVVVCDAKSFRLGRSQGAPNTKDAIKPEDYGKWIGRHTKQTPIGGLVTFPSSFDWQKGSDVYLYASNANDGKKIMLLFYQHLAYLLLKKGSLCAGGIFQILKDYKKHFPFASKERNSYWLAIDEAIEGIAGSKDLKNLLATAGLIIDECIRHTAIRITERIKSVEIGERERVMQLDEAVLREALIASEVGRKTSQDRRRLENIMKFRI